MKGKKKAKKKGPSSIKGRCLRKCKSGFWDDLRAGNPMLEYFLSLGIVSSSDSVVLQGGGSQRNGGYVFIAHARGEFIAPELSKGKLASTIKSKGRVIEG